MCAATLLQSAEARAGDAYWSDRAQGMQEARADPAPVEQAIRAYADALEADPRDLTARWKLMRALHFEGEFARLAPDARLGSFDRAIDIAEEGLGEIGDRAGAELHELDPRSLRETLAAADLDASGVARLYYWAAASWGSWSKEAGLLAAVRTGVANRLRAYLDVVVVLEPSYEGAGAHRFLGALHARLPRVPFLSGWVDRKRALPQLETALAIAPEEPSNRLLLGLTLLDLEPSQRREGLGVLSELAAFQPRAERRVEDSVVVLEARRRLEREGTTASPRAELETGQTTAPFGG
jgi:tetratricopeptide (TPR) repeat protein